jgi:hypothetical protein
MPSYRIYLRDAGRAFVSRKDLICADDGTAIDLAMAIVPPHGQARVWLGTRQVAMVSAPSEQAAIGIPV